METSQLVFGLLVGAVQLGLGILLGLWIGRRDSASQQAAELQVQQAQEMVQGVSELASSIASDVGKYRARMEQVSAKLGEVKPVAGSFKPEQLLALVNQLTQAMNQLQQRLHSAEARLREQSQQMTAYLAEARTDALTGLPNRRVFNDDLFRRFAQHQRHGEPVSLMLVDVDFFKKFNDDHGHLAGDEVLRQLAAVLRRGVRQMDLVARYGGEEFAVVLPSTESGDAGTATEHVRRGVQEATFQFNGHRLKVTISAGVATSRRRETIEGLVERADAALYASKEAGRNCSHYHDGARCLPIEAGVPAREDPTGGNPAGDGPAETEFDDVLDELRMAAQSAPGSAGEAVTAT